MTSPTANLTSGKVIFMVLVLRDDPAPLVGNTLLRSSLLGSVVSASVVGIATVGTFAFATRTGRLKALQQVSPGAVSLFSTGAAAFLGAIYGFNREVIKLSQPTTPSLPSVVQRALNSPLYKEPIDPSREDRNPRSSVAYQLIINDILHREVSSLSPFLALTHWYPKLGIITRTELVKESPFDLNCGLREGASRREFQKPLSLHHEVLATCIIGWMVLPAAGTFLLNTAVATILGASIYYIHERFTSLSNYKLMRFLLEQKVQTLQQEKILSPEEASALLAETISSITPRSSGEVLVHWATRSAFVLSRAFPVLMKLSEEELEQKKYLQHLELEYVDWRKEQGLKPVGSLF